LNRTFEQRESIETCTWKCYVENW